LQKAIDDLDDRVAVPALPVSEPVQGALLTGEGVKADDPLHRAQSGLMQPISVRIVWQRNAGKFVPPHVADGVERAGCFTQMG